MSAIKCERKSTADSVEITLAGALSIVIYYVNSVVYGKMLPSLHDISVVLREKLSLIKG